MNRHPHRKPAVLIPFCLALLLGPASRLEAAPPDLTAAGVISTIKRVASYNLGPTGLRGWIYISSGNVGPDGLITDESRQILVTVASPPASTVLAVDDVILGAMAGDRGTVPDFSSDARKAFGVAIGEAEKTGAGSLRVKRWRAGTVSEVNIPIAIMGDYTATAPYDCPKSSRILANARDKMVGQLLANENILDATIAGYINALALLASVTPTDPHYAEVQTRLQKFARASAEAGPQWGGLVCWDWAYEGLFLTEYYLGTGDAQVIAGINKLSIALAQAQSMNGTFGHNPSAFRADGSKRRVCIGYGPVNAVGITANMAIVMGKKALLSAKQPIDPEIDSAIQRGSDFFAMYVNKGSVPYGEHAPGAGSHASNGKDSMCAVFFGLQENRKAETEYFTRMSIAGYSGREYGHTGQGLSYLWGALGTDVGGPLATAEYLKKVRWHLDLERRTDGSFVYDGNEQYGAGTTADGTYLGDSSYSGLSATATYILTYALPLRRLHITGKNAYPPNTLDAPTVRNAIAAATFNLDCPKLPDELLIEALGEYDPVVRHYAAVELARRKPGSNEIDALITLLGDPAENKRQGACLALGTLQNASALPKIAAMLNDPSLVVRCEAAKALRSYPPEMASKELVTMLNAYIKNATDPNVINWKDPLQMSNHFLTLALFGNAVPDGSAGNDVADFTIDAPKNLLYPAIRVGLQHPDSYPRSGAARFCYNRLPLPDAQALIRELFEVTAVECQADRMWSSSPRADGISTLAKFNIREGIPMALAMLEVPKGFEMGAEDYQIAGLKALAAYGDAARWTLPTLRNYLTTWTATSPQFPVLVQTIDSIENATTAATQNLGKAVANPQVIATTGPKEITLTGTSPRGEIKFTNLTQPSHGRITGDSPHLTYTPEAGYRGPDRFTFQVADSITTSDAATVAMMVGNAGNGLKAEYFDNPDFTGMTLARTDAMIDFDWGTNPPATAMGADSFSVRWSGLLVAPETCIYQFSAFANDGVRLFLNGETIIDSFTDRPAHWRDSAAVSLTAGQVADIQMDYCKNTGAAAARLHWIGPSFAGASGMPISTEWLYSGERYANRPIYAYSHRESMLRNTSKAITLTGSASGVGYFIATQPAHGKLTGRVPWLKYTPAANYSGEDSFTFYVKKGIVKSSRATISIGIRAGLPVSHTWANATSGNWSDAADWKPAPPVSGGNATCGLNFTTAGTYTVTQDLSSGFKLNQLNTAAAINFAGSQPLDFVANGSQLPQFDQTSNNPVTFDVPLVLSAMTSFDGYGSGQVKLNGQLSGPGGLIKNNPGILVISNASNTHTGGTIINNGRVMMPSLANAGLGGGPVTLNGGCLHLDRLEIANPLTANGGRIFSDNGYGNSWLGPVTLKGNLTIEGEGYAHFTITGSVGGEGGLIVNGPAPVRLQAANSYTGQTTINGGSLTCLDPSALGTGALDIASGAKVILNYKGTRTITRLTLDNRSPAAPGTYGSAASDASHKDDVHFSGTGTVTVLPPKGSAR